MAIYTKYGTKVSVLRLDDNGDTTIKFADGETGKPTYRRAEGGRRRYGDCQSVPGKPHERAEDMPWLTHYDVPERGGHNYADSWTAGYREIVPDDVDAYGSAYCWEARANTHDPQ
jgi:hypothetical protein